MPSPNYIPAAFHTSDYGCKRCSSHARNTLNPMMQLPDKQLLNANRCRHSSVSKNLLCLLRRGNDPSRPRRTILPRKLKKQRPKDFFLAHSDKASKGKPLQPLPPRSSNGNFVSMPVSFRTSVPRVLSVMSFYFLASQSCGIRNFVTTVPKSWTIWSNFDRGNHFILLEPSSFWGRAILFILFWCWIFIS